MLAAGESRVALFFVFKLAFFFLLLLPLGVLELPSPERGPMASDTPCDDPGPEANTRGTGSMVVWKSKSAYEKKSGVREAELEGTASKRRRNMQR